MSPTTVIAAATSFVAIDFETADYGRDSACAIGLVRVENDRIVRQVHRLIRPPRRQFVFTYLHGIAWSDVADQPTFGELWPELKAELAGVDYFAAHNASFDRGVLTACCRAAGIAPPRRRFVCTVALARQVWDIRPTKLDNVCSRLQIKLKHHEALSDASACAQIILAATKAGAQF